MQASQHLRRKKPAKLAGTPRVQSLDGDVADAALLERQRARRAEQVRGKLAKSGFMADQRDAVMLCRPIQFVHHLRRRVARGKRVERLHRSLVAETVRQERRRLLRAHEGARENFVDIDLEPREPFDDFPEPVDAGFGQRALGIVTPFLAAFRGYRVSNQIKVAGVHVSGGRAAGVFIASGALHQPLTHCYEFGARSHVMAMQLPAFVLEPPHKAIEVGRHLQC